MKTRTKVLLLTLCAVLLVVSTVFATMAFLTSTDTVTNTFTFGRIEITLDEATVGTDGEITDGADRNQTTGRRDTNTYHLIPGHLYTKDPTIHVSNESEDCWLFVKIENGLKDIIAEVTIENQMTNNNGWTLINETNNIYAYRDVVSKNAHIPVFDEFKLKNDADVQNYGEAKIVVTAYAVQADGFNLPTKTAIENATDAWNATFGETSN